MQDLTDELARLKAAPGAPAPDSAVHADLERGRRALRTRRHRRTAMAGAVAAVAVTAGSLSYAFAPSGSASHPDAASRNAASHDASAGGASHPSAAHSSAAQHTLGNDDIALVAYHGPQKRGYTVRYVPKGYVVQGVTAATLDIARADDHSSLNTFIGKIVVTLDDDIAVDENGTRVTVHGHPGWLRDAQGATMLEYRDAGHHVTVQQWQNVHVSHADLIRFADGVTVTKQAVTSHG